MTSLASLAHAAAPAPPAFNGLFYATAATIIPVFFIAIAVQGTTSARPPCLNSASVNQAVLKASLTAASNSRNGARARQALTYCATALLLLSAEAILIAGAFGELSALS